jgi:hypothetical protein
LSLKGRRSNSIHPVNFASSSTSHQVVRGLAAELK